MDSKGLRIIWPVDDHCHVVVGQKNEGHAKKRNSLSEDCKNPKFRDENSKTTHTSKA